MWAIVTTERPSSVVRRPSVNFSHFNQLLWSHWANLNQTLVEWSLDGPLPKLCPVIPISNQDGHQAKNRKKGGWNLKKIFSSETTEPISTKLWWNDHWVVPFQNCVRHFRPPTKMAATAEFNLTYDPMGNSHKNLLLRNHWANCNQTLVGWSLGGPLPKLCPGDPDFQPKCQAKNRKKGGWNLKKIFSSETTEPISTKLCWNDPWVVPFQNCV